MILLSSIALSPKGDIAILDSSTAIVEMLLSSIAASPKNGTAHSIAVGVAYYSSQFSPKCELLDVWREHCTNTVQKKFASAKMSGKYQRNWFLLVRSI